MVNWKIGKFHIRNLEIFTVIMLTIIFTLAAIVREGTWLYNWIASVSSYWVTIAAGGSALLMGFAFATFGNTSVLIYFPYALIVYNIGQHYPHWWLLGIVSGIGAGIGEITSYLIGLAIGSSKKMSESEMGEKFHRIRKAFEKKPGAIPWTIFLFAATPLPDDMILVPFGIMKFPYYKTVFPCMAGKTLLCMLLAFLGYMVGLNAQFIDSLIAAYPVLGFLRFVVPSADVNPSGDLLQFSFIFIVIYFMARFDFEKIMMRRSEQRKEFLQILTEGGIFTFEELTTRFKISNVTNFKKFLEQFIGKYPNLEKHDDSYQFNALKNQGQAREQSYEFATFLFH
jgi:membrane protein YqaA with SNARE-associated domain